ncbi:MAG: hypothetical protein OEZ13_05740 [Spirochaetia bacterium]|nr:hypothetical protein [Spirochaetia bacterium]
MNKNNFSKSIIISFLIIILINCTGKPILSELANSRINVILKGTYESNNPYSWNTDSYVDDAYSSATITGLTNVIPGNAIPLVDQKYYIDIAEIRISKQNEITDTTILEDYWHYFARERQVLCSETAALYEKQLDSCDTNNGVEKINEFFNEGFSYPAVDLESGKYQHLAIYVRKMITYPSKSYNSDGSFYDDIVAAFDNKRINGYDISSRYQWAAADDTAEDTPRLFPLQRTDLSLEIPETDKNYVLEIRVFLKNLMMKHLFEYTEIDTGEIKYLSFLGPSDHKANHQFNDATNKGKLGGNILIAARAYVPDETGSIRIINDTGADGSVMFYYAVMPSGETFDSSAEIPYAATNGGNNIINNLPEGDYDIYKTCDKSRNADDITSSTDGFPETASLSCATVSVQAGVESQVDLGTCDCQ